MLLAESAVQQNRIRQLTPRLAAAAAAAGLPVTAVDARIIPKRPAPQAGVPIPRIERAPSAVGAAAISGILDDIEDPALKATMERLRNVIKPGEENRRRLLEERLGRESIDLSTERMRLTTLVADLTHGINAAIIPTEEEARDYPRLEAERERKLSFWPNQKDRRLVAVHPGSSESTPDSTPSTARLSFALGRAGRPRPLSSHPKTRKPLRRRRRTARFRRCSGRHRVARARNAVPAHAQGPDEPHSNPRSR